MTMLSQELAINIITGDINLANIAKIRYTGGGKGKNETKTPGELRLEQ